MMSLEGVDFIDQLVAEHRTIQRLLEDILSSDFNSSDCFTKLCKAEMLIVSHLSKEDEVLYPALKSGGSTHLAMDYSEEMGQISLDVISFFKQVQDDFF